MRDINFRVWDNLEKAYLNEKDIAFLFVKIFDILLVYLYLCYNISTVCELRERNSEVKRSYVF